MRSENGKTNEREEVAQSPKSRGQATHPIDFKYGRSMAGL